MPDILCTFTKLVLISTLRGRYYYLYFHTKKQRLREFNSLSQGHTASKDLNPRLTQKISAFSISSEIYAYIPEIFFHHLRFVHIYHDTDVNFLESLLNSLGLMAKFFGPVTFWVIEE